MRLIAFKLKTCCNDIIYIGLSIKHLIKVINLLINKVDFLLEKKLYLQIILFNGISSFILTIHVRMELVRRVNFSFNYVFGQRVTEGQLI